VLDDLASLAHRFSELASDATTIALSRPTPSEVFTKVHLPSTAEVFQVDERDAPERSEDRNATLIERELRPLRFHPMPAGGSPETYERAILDRLGEPPVFDVVHLGLGPDGHTASLLPGDPVLDVHDRWVAVTQPAAGFERMTLTYPTLDAARQIVFVVAGASKAEAMARVVSGDRSQPAARIANENVLFLIDAPAASRLQ
jgi:6-phosphogluconolactonase